MYSYALGMYEKALPNDMPLEEKLDRAKEAGFDYVELCIDQNKDRAKRLNWSREEIRYWRELAWEKGIPFTTFSLSYLRDMPLGILDTKMNRQSLETIERACEIAVGLGSRVILINGYDVYYEPSTPATRERFFENLNKAVEIATRYGIAIGIENAEMSFCKTISDARAICDRAPSSYLGIYGDYGNQVLAFEGDNDAASQDMMMGAGKFNALHIKDTCKDSYRFDHWGEGWVDFDMGVAMIKKLGIRLITAEIFCDESGDYLTRIIEANSNLRALLDRDHY